MTLPPYASPVERLWQIALRIIVAGVLGFLMLPILIVVPLSFSSESFFTFPMPGLSLRWYAEFFTSDRWLDAVWHSVVIAVATTFFATVLGTLAAQGLSRRTMPARGLIMVVLISPMIVPTVITAVGIYFFLGQTGLLNSFAGIIVAHTALATPFVVITVLSTLTGYDTNLNRAGASLGAGPRQVFFRVTLPLILPGVISGALFAFVTSFDEVVCVLFIASPDQRTLPMQMFSGIREQISPTITAVATLLILFSTVMLASMELLRRRSERLRLHG
ncbi:MAG TPA: ABC transporter permease [Stellaceae bacterium]|nr:ABC transporter permease [Stellaceae bacterium]